MKWLVLGGLGLLALKASGHCPFCAKAAAPSTGSGSGMHFGVQYPTIQWPGATPVASGDVATSPGFGVSIDTGAAGGGTICAQVMTQCADGYFAGTPCDCASHGGPASGSGGGLTL